MIAIVLAARALEWWPRTATLRARASPSPARSPAIAILPVYLPYRRAARDQHMVRIARHRQGLLRDAAWAISRRPAACTSRPGADVSSRIRSTASFPGSPCSRSPAWRSPPRPGGVRTAPIRCARGSGCWWRLAVAGFVLSLGTATPVYGWLFAVFPPMQGLRAAARFGNLFLLGVAVLGGIGLARVRWQPAAIALVVLVNVESLRAPFAYQPFHGIPAIYTTAGRRARSGGPGGTAVLPALGDLPERAVRAGVDGALAAADERLQRLHARHLSALRRRVLVFPGRTGRSRR